MRVIFIHGDVRWKLAKRQKRASRKFLRFAEFPEGDRKNAIITKIHLFKGDEKLGKDLFINELRKSIELLKAENVVILPFAHLDEDTALTMEALKAYRYLSNLRLVVAEEFGMQVPLIPFGVDKDIILRLKPHLYCAHFREFLPEV